MSLYSDIVLPFFENNRSSLTFSDPGETSVNLVNFLFR